MEQALKQRLIGGVVLVALAVIIVPLLLEAPSPDATPASALPLDIPPRPDTPMQTRDVPLSLPSLPPPAASTDPDPVDPDRVVTVDAENTPRVDALADPRPAASPPAAAPAATPTPAAPTRAASMPATGTAAPSPPAPAAVAEGRFVVNLGTFANQANADALAKRLRDRNHNVLVESLQLEGRPAQRLRAGPYRTRAEAEAAALRISQSEPGSRFSVGQLDTAAPVAAAASPVAAGFAVQVGALKSEAEANTLRDRLRTAGFAAYVERTQTDAGVLWRVRAGPELQRPRAEALREEIKQKLKLDGLVVAHP